MRSSASSKKARQQAMVNPVAAAKFESEQARPKKARKFSNKQNESKSGSMGVEQDEYEGANLVSVGQLDTCAIEQPDGGRSEEAKTRQQGVLLLPGTTYNDNIATPERSKHSSAGSSSITMLKASISLQTQGLAIASQALSSLQPSIARGIADTRGDDVTLHSSAKKRRRQRVPSNDHDELISFRSGQSSSSKKQGLTQKNVQKMIEIEGPRISGLDVAIGTTTAKTNPASMRDKIKMDHTVNAKNLTPRGAAFATSICSYPPNESHGDKFAGSSLIVQPRQSQNEFHAQLPASLATASQSSIKHLENVSTVGASQLTGNKGKNRQVVSSTLADIEKKYMGVQPSSKKLNGVASSKHAGGMRGTSGSIDLRSGTGSITLMKTKSIHGPKAGELSGLQLATTRSQYQFTTMTPKHQHFASKQGGLQQQSPLLSSPQKIRMQHPRLNQQRGKKGLKNAQATTNRNTTQHGVAYHQRTKEIADSQHYNSSVALATKSNTNSSGGTGRKVNNLNVQQEPGRVSLISTGGANHLSKVPSEKKLITTSHGPAKLDLTEFGRLTPRDNKEGEQEHATQAKVTSSQPDESAQKSSRLTSSTGRKSFQHGYQLSQASYINDYLVKSQNNMKQLQQTVQPEASSVKAMSSTLMPIPPQLAFAQPNPHQPVAQNYSQTLHNATRVSQQREMNRKSQVQIKKFAIQSQLTQSKGGSGPRAVVRQRTDLQKQHLSATQPPKSKVKTQSNNFLYQAPQPHAIDIESVGSNELVQSHYANETRQKSVGQNEKNLFFNVHDSSTLVQEPQTYKDIEQCLDEDVLSSGQPSNHARWVPSTAREHVQSLVEGTAANHSASLDDADIDGLPIVEELQDDYLELSKKQCSPIAEEDFHEPKTQLEELDAYIERRNNTRDSQVNMNVIKGQRTEIFDRNQVQLFSDKKSDIRSIHIKSLMQPMTQSKENILVYNAKAGTDQSKNIVAKGGLHPTSTRHSQGEPKSSASFTNPIAKAHYSLSSKHLGGSASIHNNAVMSKSTPHGYPVHHSSKQLHQDGSKALPSASAATSKMAKVKSGPTPNHHKAFSQTSKDVYKVTGGGNRQKEGLPTKTSAGSFDSRTGSHSMSYIPPRRLQDPTFQQMTQQVPLSRAELNNQSVQQQQAALDSKSTSQSQKKGSQAQPQGLPVSLNQNRSSTNVAEAVNSEQNESSKRQHQRLVKPAGCTGESSTPVNAVFSRSQSNHLIGAAATQNVTSKRLSNSQSRIKSKDQQQRQESYEDEKSQPQHKTSFSLGGGKRQATSTAVYFSSSGKKSTAGSKLALGPQSRHQQAKMMRKNQNNLKMSSMLLKEQDFKKITSQIQSQTIQNARKKKIQLSIGAPAAYSSNVQVAQSATGVSQAHQTTNLNRSIVNQSSAVQQSQEPALESQYKVQQKPAQISSTHRRSIPQVPSQNIIGTYLSPTDGGAEIRVDSTARSGSHGSGHRRKFAYSLNDKYQGAGGFDELFQKKTGPCAGGSHVSSSDGGASYMIPSENERIESGSKTGDKIVNDTVSGSKAKAGMRVLTGLGSQGAIYLQPSHPITTKATGSNLGKNTIFFADQSSASVLDQRKSSQERATILPSQINKKSQTQLKNQGSQKKIEPHRLVKVSKPLNANSLLSKNFDTNSAQKMTTLSVIKQQHHLSYSNHKPQQPLPTGLLSTNPNLQKKSGSFGAGFREPQAISTSTHQLSNNSNSFLQSSIGTKAVGGPSATAPISHHSTQNQPYQPQESGCQSPEQPVRKQQIHLNGQGPGSLIANANLIRQAPHESFTMGTVSSDAIKGPPNTAVSGTKSMAFLKKSINQARSGETSSLGQALVKTATPSVQLKSTSPSKKMTKRLSSKIQAAGYTAELQTATKKILQHNQPVPNDTSQKVLNSNGQVDSIRKLQPLTLTGQNEDSQQSQSGLDALKQASSSQCDTPKTQNIQLLRSVQHKQITTASKGKESGSVTQIKGSLIMPDSAKAATGSKSSLSVVVPSTESVAQSKAILLKKPEAAGVGKSEKLSALLQSSAEKKQRRPVGGSVIVPANSAAHGKEDEIAPLVLPLSQGRDDHGMQVRMEGRGAQKLGQSDKVGDQFDVLTDNCISDADQDSQQHLSPLQQTNFISTKFAPPQALNPLNVIEERLESQESAVSDPNVSPRTRHILKLQKKIKFSFLKSGYPPETQTENYKIGKVMGKGAFGKVNLAIHRLSGKFVALKSINKQFLNQEQSKRKVMQEFNILRRTRHFNIVRLYESFETQQHIVFVMEVCGGGDLLTYVRRRRKLKEETAQFLFRQIINGLACCHQKRVLHRDIKLDNILLTSQGDVKICDFGVSQLVTPDETMTEQCGTPAYIAPEVFRNLGYQNFASDIWSAGVVLYAMLFGAVPFKASNMAELHRQVIEKQPSYKEEEVSVEAISLLKGILEKDPSQRLTSEQILSHEWMQPTKKRKSILNSEQIEGGVFSEAEKQAIVAEFEYYNKRERDVIVDGEYQVVPTDPFAEQMLSSTQNSLLKNVSTRSIILAPFNSTVSKLTLTEGARERTIKSMLEPRGAIKFSARCREIDRQYEQNNNADLDNGVYHLDEEDEVAKESKNDSQAGTHPAAQPGEERPESRMRGRAVDEESIADSFNQEHLQSQLDELDEGNNSFNSAELDERGRRSATYYVTPATSAKRVTSEHHKAFDSAVKHENLEQHPLYAGQKQLSEWRRLERQMISDRGSPPKQILFDQKIMFEEIKGDKNMPESGDLGQDLGIYEEGLPGSANRGADPEQTYEEGAGASAQAQTSLAAAPSLAENNKHIGQTTLVIDEGSVTGIERCGYPKPYVKTSLNNDDLNHVTTFYYLLQTQNEY